MIGALLSGAAGGGMSQSSSATSKAGDAYVSASTGDFTMGSATGAASSVASGSSSAIPNWALAAALALAALWIVRRK